MTVGNGREQNAFQSILINVKSQGCNLPSLGKVNHCETLTMKQRHRSIETSKHN